MKEGPNIAGIASLVGDPARANMLSALMGGVALTASELALEAGVGLPTTSSHLGKLMDGGLLSVASQGRHRYYRLASTEVAHMIEAISGVAQAAGPRRYRPGPKDSAMRHARVCYDHLAGEQGVALFDSLQARGIVEPDGAGLRLGSAGASFLEAAGIDVTGLRSKRRPMCRACLDWSERRTHLAGTLGAAILQTIIANRWARRDPHGRALLFTPPGKAKFDSLFLAS